MLEDWTIYSWYCPNCKTQVAGLKNKKNQIRVICTKCSAEMVRTVVGRRHDVIDIYAPIGMEHDQPGGQPQPVHRTNRLVQIRKRGREALQDPHSAPFPWRSAEDSALL